MGQKILLVAHGHPELTAGGAERVAYSLFKALRDDPSVDASFLAATDMPPYHRSGTPFSAFRGREDETVFYSDVFDHFLFSQPTDIIDQFEVYLRKVAPDVIHLHHYSYIGLEFIALARRLFPKLRIVVTFHEYLAICNRYGQMLKADGRSLCYRSEPQECAACFPDIASTQFLLRKLFIQAHFAKVDVFVAPSEFLRRRYIEWGLPEGRIVRIDNGAPPFQAQSSRPRVQGEGRGVFGYFGQINPYKGLLDLLKAFELVAAAPPAATSGIRLIVYGANLEYNKSEYVEAVTKALMRNTSRVHFAGPYRHDDISRLMGAVDWVVVPSIWWENAPLVIEEALAHKRPVICSNIGGMAEKVVSGRDGFHFQVGNPFELAGLILRLAADVATWDRLQTTMRHTLAMDEWVRSHLDLYRQDGFRLAS